MFNAQEPEWPPRIDELQREMERFFDHVHRGKRPRVVFSEWAWSPHVDVFLTDDRAIVLADLAGVQPDQIQIDVQHDLLILRGERQPRNRSDLGNLKVFALEVPYGPFERRVKLPFAVDAGSAEASYRDGFLEIVLPRSVPQQPHRVQIRSMEGDE